MSVDILDCAVRGDDEESFMTALNLSKCKVLGIQLFSYDVSMMSKLLVRIRRENPKIMIVLGGAHPTSEPTRIFEQFPDADTAFCGEAEAGMSTLCELYLNRRPVEMSSVPGLIWKNGDGHTVVNPQSFCTELDEIEMPAWDLIDPRRYKHAPQGGFLKRYPYAPISTSRGCPFSCTYCTVHIVSGRKMRYRTVADVMGEIQYLVKQFGVKELHIIDDAFTANKKRVLEFCDALEASGLDVTFTFPNGIRLDTLDREILTRMKQAGLQDFDVGIESGSDKILTDMKKKLTTELAREKTQLIRDCGLHASGFFIIGYPTETREDILKTIAFAKSLPIKRAQFSLFKAYPGTEITKWLLDTGRIKGLNYDSFMYYKTDYVPEGMTADELKKLQRKAFLSFYLRPSAIWNLIRDVKSFEHLRFITKRIWYSLFAR